MIVGAGIVEASVADTAALVGVARSAWQHQQQRKKERYHPFIFCSKIATKYLNMTLLFYVNAAIVDHAFRVREMQL